MLPPQKTEGPPVISVITVVLNGAQHLEHCLQSVRMQLGVRHEHIVIDGGSSDGSQALIRRYEDGLAVWRSEPDQGIGDAMNKGAALARGEWLLFLHADDYLLDQQALAQCWQVLQSRREDIVGFPLRFGGQKDHRIVRPRGDGVWTNLKTGWLHQATFLRRRTLQSLGGYDLRFRIVMDYELFLRARRQGVATVTLPAPIPTHMRDTGISSQTDARSLARRFAEERRVHRLHSPSRLADLGYALYWALYPLYRRLRG